MLLAAAAGFLFVKDVQLLIKWTFIHYLDFAAFPRAFEVQAK